MTISRDLVPPPPIQGEGTRVYHHDERALLKEEQVSTREGLAAYELAREVFFGAVEQLKTSRPANALQDAAGALAAATWLVDVYDRNQAVLASSVYPVRPHPDRQIFVSFDSYPAAVRAALATHLRQVPITTTLDNVDRLIADQNPDVLIATLRFVRDLELTDYTKYEAAERILHHMETAESSETVRELIKVYLENPEFLRNNGGRFLNIVLGTLSGDAFEKAVPVIAEHRDALGPYLDSRVASWELHDSLQRIGDYIESALSLINRSTPSDFPEWRVRLYRLADRAIPPGN